MQSPAVRARYSALAQRRARGKAGESKNNNVDLQTAQILLAWESGDLSEGQVAKALQLGRVDCRMLKCRWRADGYALAAELAGKDSLDLCALLPGQIESLYD